VILVGDIFFSKPMDFGGQVATSTHDNGEPSMKIGLKLVKHEAL